MPRRCHTVDSLSKCACCCLDRRDVLHGHIERDRDGSFISPQREGRNKEHGQREKAEGKEAEDLQEHIGTRRTWNIIRCAYCCYPTTSIRIPSTSTCISPSPSPTTIRHFCAPLPFNHTHSLSLSLLLVLSQQLTLLTHNAQYPLSLCFLPPLPFTSLNTNRERERETASTDATSATQKSVAPLLLSASSKSSNRAISYSKSSNKNE